MKIFYKILISLLIFKGLIMSNLAMSTPFFGVDIDLHNLGSEVRVNDIPVYFDEEKGQLKVEMPAPDSIIDGLNSLNLSIFLPYDGDERVLSYDENAYITATLFQQDLSDKLDKKTNLVSATLKISGDTILVTIENYLTKEKSNSSIPLSDDNKVSVEVSANIKSPFPRWAWQEGQIIENNEKNYKSLLNIYKNIYQTMKQQDQSLLEKFYRYRAIETAIAYGLNGEKEGHKKLSTGKDMFNKALDLYDFHSDGVYLEIYGNGHLARIRDEMNVQPIFFYETKPGLFHFYKFGFYLNSKNEWVMIR